MERHLKAMKTPLFLIIIFLILLFLIESPVGDIVGWMNNDVCYRLLGCNQGFFGFDFLVHITSGATLSCLMMWLTYHYPRFQIIDATFAVKFVIFISIIALIGYVWELSEFVHDEYRMNVQHEQLLTPNHLDQASDADTMGDMFASLCGAGAALLIGRAIKKDII